MGVQGSRVRANWYAQLSQKTAAGLTLVEALETTPGPKPADKQALLAALPELDLAGALQQRASWLGALDRAVWVAALQSGTFPEAAASLAEHYRELGKARGKVIGALLYPLLVVHLAILCFSVLHLTFGALDVESTSPFTFVWGDYLGQVAAGMAGLWGALLLLHAWRTLHPGSLHAVLRRLPGIAQYLRAQGLERFCRLLADLLEAGVSLRKSLTLAGETTGDPRMAAATRQLAEAVGNGRAPGGLMGAQGVWPVDFVALYQTGEKTGQLEATLRQQMRHYRNSATRWLAACAFFYPQLVFLIIAGVLMNEVLQAYGHYFEQLQNWDRRSGW